MISSRRAASVAALFTVLAAGASACEEPQRPPAAGSASAAPQAKAPGSGSASPAGVATSTNAPPPSGPATPADAEAFTKEIDGKLRKLWVHGARAAWVKANFVTDDTDALATAAEEANMAYLREVIPKSVPFAALTTNSPEVSRQLHLLRLAQVAPSPADQAERDELSSLVNKMPTTYSTAKYCPEGGECQTLQDLSRTLAKSRDDSKLREAWIGWHEIAKPLKTQYSRFVELGNKGAKEIGFADMGVLWRSKYDMPPDDFKKEVDRLYDQVKPVYEKLHCYTRRKLTEKYGAEKVPATGPIPAHVLGNMWAQDWSALYSMLEPFPGELPLDVDAGIKKKNLKPLEMAKIAEDFFKSLGLDALPDTFWTRSLFERPRDREVECHASAWDVTLDNDLRIKMCIEPTEDDLITLHHELGHNYYYHYYHELPVLLQDGANDGFHEGIGDTLALSVTPTYLKTLGLIDKVVESDKADINFLMNRALSKVAFLPFGKLIDEWRWGVFSGAIKPEGYNTAWWEMKLKMQGVVPPVPRGEEFFDPGAKYHVPGNTPYMRYFLAAIYQFQFHRALCKVAGQTGPLHKCSIYGSKDAGDRMKKMLAMGASKPWPDALEALTGERAADATAMLDYFDPLVKWLDEQNKGDTCGW